MSAPAQGSYFRTLSVVACVSLAVIFATSNLRVAVWDNLMPFFQWMESSLFGVIGKTWGAAFAVVEAFHLLAMALLGGAVLVSSGHLLGLVFTDQSSKIVLDRAHRIFLIGLAVAMLSGVFLACGVAMKIYYMPVYWYKMLALSVGILFVLLVQRPLLAHNIEDVQPWVRRLTAIASLMIWFSVAATGRWIGFSG